MSFYNNYMVHIYASEIYATKVSFEQLNSYPTVKFAFNDMSMSVFILP